MTERLYYSNSFTVQFTASVTDVRLYSREDGRALWQVSLDRSAFYPTSGGQPHDTGTLTATAQSGAVLVADIESVEEDADGEVWHTTTKPLPAGTLVEGNVDWVRRLDHMQQHSGQHLLSAMFLSQLGMPTVSFHLGAELSTIDLALPDAGREPAEAELVRVAEAANQAIAANHALTVESVTRARAEQMFAEGRLRKLPEREGEIRIVHMENIEWNACGGTHVAATGQIGGLSLRKVEKLKQGTVRVSFVCGVRAASAARRDFLLLEEASRQFSVGSDALLQRIESLQEQVRAMQKQQKSERMEIASLLASQLASEARDATLLEREMTGRDSEMLRLIAVRLVEAKPSAVVLLFSAMESSTAMVLAAGAACQVHCGKVLQAALAANGVRGGGGPTLAQAEVPNGKWLAIRARVMELLQDSAAGVLA